MEYLGSSKRVNQINPLVSVCVPTFNHEQYIRSCLDSVLNQEVDFSFEVLIGEDDGKDDTRKICKEIAEANQDKVRLFLRKEEDKIQLYGRKSGRGNHLGLYKSARGKYICVLDGDDLWLDPQKLQKQVNLMEQYPAAFICITNTILEKNPDLDPPGIPHKFRVFAPQELHKVFYMGHISSWMLRNSMKELLANEIVKKPIPLDKVLFSFYKKRGDVIYIPELTSKYRFNPNGVYLSRSSKKNMRALLRHNWYLFKYIHQDFLLWLRTNFYVGRRYLKLTFNPKNQN